MLQELYILIDTLIIGQLLGAGKMDEAVDTDRKLIMFSVLSCTVTAVLLLAVAPFFPNIYNTSADVKQLAVWFIMVLAFAMPHNAFLNAAYFTIRSGGKTIITFLFDSVFTWGVMVTTATVLLRFTGIDIVWAYFIVSFTELIKNAIGHAMVKSNVWLNQIV